jgi:tetratricopeptide (TPR) repeat protein
MNDPRLDDIARAVAAGDPVDWHSAEAGASDSESVAMLQGLRVVACIASFYKSPAPPPTPSLDHPGESISSNDWGSLRITRSIGSGSFGDVYEAYDPALDRVVALKLLRSIERTAVSRSAEVIEEGRVLARVRHPHVVTVFGAARIDGRAGIWMELVRGRTLAGRVSQAGPMNATDAAAAVRDVCFGLAAVHCAGIVHRDVKAQNVMQDESGHIVLMDLGAGYDASGASAEAMAGTPAYLAPEILRGEPATPRCDIYSAGVLLFYLTTATYPVSGASLDDLRAQHASGTRVTLRQAGAKLPRSLASIIERALAESPKDRFTAREMADALERFVRRRARRARAAVAGAAIAGLAIIVAVGLPRWLKSSSAAVADTRKLILVGAFDNHTRKDLFERTIQAGLEYELSRSTLAVAPSIRVDDALKLLKQPIDSALTPTLGREVARRDGGIQFLIVGRIDTAADGDAISAEIVDPVTGAARTSIRVRVASDALAPRAVQQLALELRQRLGESRDSGARPTRSTISLESLRDYSETLRLGNRGNWRGALQYVQRAVRRDPAFAMAQIWLAWCESNTGAAAEALATAAAAEAAAHDDALTAWERESILGKAAGIRGERERAILHYDAALKVQPDDFWTTNRLANLYYGSGAMDQAVKMATHAADLRPRDLYQQVLATRWLLQNGRDASEVTLYNSRALDLLDLDIAKSRPIDASFALLVPAELTWRAQHAAATASELARVASDPRVVATPELMPPVFEHAAALYLAMGRIASARNLIGQVSLVGDREVLLAIADYYAGDLWSEGQHLDRVCASRGDLQEGIRRLPLCTQLLLQAGRLDDTQALVNRAKANWDPNHVQSSLGELAAARHDPDVAIQMLGATIDRLNPGSAQYLWAVRMLSDAWLEKQQRDTAIGTLRSALSHPYNPDPGAGLEATALSFRLAALYRSAGAVSEASFVEAGAMRGLDQADPGFVDRLRSLGSAGLDR